MFFTPSYFTQSYFTQTYFGEPAEGGNIFLQGAGTILHAGIFAKVIEFELVNTAALLSAGVISEIGPPSLGNSVILQSGNFFEEIVAQLTGTTVTINTTSFVKIDIFLPGTQVVINPGYFLVTKIEGGTPIEGATVVVSTTSPPIGIDKIIEGASIDIQTNITYFTAVEFSGVSIDIIASQIVEEIKKFIGTAVELGIGYVTVIVPIYIAKGRIEIKMNTAIVEIEQKEKIIILLENP